jgi:hypothetical protein
MSKTRQHRGAGEEGFQGNRLDQREGVGEAGAAGRSALRLCTLGAQSAGNAEREVRREVEKELTGKEEKPSELIYFKVYKSQIPAIEQAIETAALMLVPTSRLLFGDDLCRLPSDNGNPRPYVFR